jgi:hypothetical protein
MNRFSFLWCIRFDKVVLHQDYLTYVVGPFNTREEAEHFITQHPQYADGWIEIITKP